MISRSHEQQILRDYEDLLTSERESLRADEAKVDKRRTSIENLEGIVKGLAARVGASSGVTPTPQLVLGAGASVRHGQPTFTSLVRELMADGVARTTNDVFAVLSERDALPAGMKVAAQKQKIANRLIELTQQNYLIRPDRGVYQLASVEASKNGAGPEGPNLPSHDNQKPPDEEVMSPRPGHSTESVLMRNQAPT
jgi:hypothetical protein